MSEKEPEKSFRVVDKRKVSETEGEERENWNVGGSEKANVNSADEASMENESKQPETVSEKKAADEAGAEALNFEADFATFIYSLNTQALLFMGKIPNPISKKYEKDLGTAKYLIDTIDMLSKKTKGNLDENEAKLIENILYDLRMAYISEKK